jgi:hypothetical protein
MKTSLAGKHSADEPSRHRVSNAPPPPSVSRPIARDMKHVEELIAMRRSVSLRLKRTGRETDRVMLETIDTQLALHRIDIPTFKQWLKKYNR